MQEKCGTVFTFYSYKGGVGRTMALANVAALLSKWGRKVLVVDWDLEAPGLERYFDSKGDLAAARKETPGIIDLVHAFSYEEGRRLNWRDCLLKCHPFDRSNPAISILSAGRETPEYARNLQALEWEKLFRERNLGTYIEDLRNQWTEVFDDIIIDSRTGITDIGGICSVHLPDVLILMFTANNQSLDGVIDVFDKARTAHRNLPFDRVQILGLPIAARDESRTEYKQALEWRRKFARDLESIYREWLPRDKTPANFIDILRIPYVPYWSFGERLAVVSESGMDPASLSFSYDTLARLIANRLDWEEVLEGPAKLVLVEADTTAKLTFADDLLSKLDPPQQHVAVQKLARLVRISGGGVLSRQSILAHALVSEADPTIKGLLDLGVLSKKVEAGGTEHLQIAQDGLLEKWEWLRSKVKQDDEFLSWRQNLQSYLADWLASDKREEGLLGGPALKRAAYWQQNRAEDLDSVERRFIEESTRRNRRKRRRIAVGFAFLVLVAALALSGWYWIGIRAKALRLFAGLAEGEETRSELMSLWELTGATRSVRRAFLDTALSTPTDAFLGQSDTVIHAAVGMNSAYRKDFLKSVVRADCQPEEAKNGVLSEKELRACISILNGLHADPREQSEFMLSAMEGTKNPEVIANLAVALNLLGESLSPRDTGRALQVLLRAMRQASKPSDLNKLAQGTGYLRSDLGREDREEAKRIIVGKLGEFGKRNERYRELSLSLVRGFVSLADTLSSAEARELLELIKTKNYVSSDDADNFEVLASRLSPVDAVDLSRQLIGEIESAQMSSGIYLAALIEGSARGRAGGLDDNEKQRLIVRLLEKIKVTQDDFDFLAVERPLRALRASLTPSQAVTVWEVIFYRMERTPDNQLFLRSGGETLEVVGSRIEPQIAQVLFERVIRRIERTDSPLLLRGYVQALRPWEEQISASDLDRVASSLLNALRGPRGQDDYAVADALGMLENLPSEARVEALAQLIDAMRRTDESAELERIARGIDNLGELSSPALQRTAGSAFDLFLASIKPMASPPCYAVRHFIQDAKDRRVIDVLKWPTCSSSDRNILIEKIDSLVSDSFDTAGQDGKYRADIWAFVEWAEREGLDPANPPEAPKDLKLN